MRKNYKCRKRKEDEASKHWMKANGKLKNGTLLSHMLRAECHFSEEIFRDFISSKPDPRWYVHWSKGTKLLGGGRRGRHQTYAESRAGVGLQLDLDEVAHKMLIGEPEGQLLSRGLQDTKTHWSAPDTYSPEKEDPPGTQCTNHHI